MDVWYIVVTVYRYSDGQIPVGLSCACLGGESDLDSVASARVCVMIELSVPVAARRGHNQVKVPAQHPPEATHHSFFSASCPLFPFLQDTCSFGCIRQQRIFKIKIKIT